MFATREFLLRARLDAKTLRAYIEAGWLLPRDNGHARRFSEADLARARLIRDLKKDMGVNDEGITVVLDLVDQVHGLRRTLRELLAAICTQSEVMRRRIAAEIRDAASARQNGEGTDQALLPGARTGRSG
jgi:chaperone modulatory protein CbpM